MPGNRQLGRLAPARNPAVPALRAILPNLSPAPAVVNWWADIGAWPMLANDSVGDCTIAALGHAVQAMSSYTSTPLLMTDAEAISAYSAITDYNPANPSTDQGAVIEAVLAYAANTGMTIAGRLHKIQAFVSINYQDKAEIRAAINLFGGLDIGVDLPLSAQTQPYLLTCTNAGTASVANSWGGHCVWACGADDYGVDVIYWGARYRILWDFWHAYVVEAHAILDPAFMTAPGATPADVPWDQLQQTMQRLAA
jgi:hypothetical protein